jgi:hypothetical protein
MTDDSDKHGGPAGRSAEQTGKNPKHDRLKLALRENLKRRKTQMRGRDQQASSASESGEGTPYDGGADGSQK